MGGLWTGCFSGLFVSSDSTVVKSFAIGEESSLVTPVWTISELVGELVVVDEAALFVIGPCSLGTRCSSPGQHMREAVNFIGRLGGRDVPCLERLTLPSDVTIRLKEGLPVQVYGWADAMVEPIPEWNVGTVVEMTEVEVVKTGAWLESDVPDNGSAI